MIEISEIKILPKYLHDDHHIRKIVQQKLKIDSTRIKKIEVKKRSIDARGRSPFYLLRLAIHIDKIQSEPRKTIHYGSVGTNAKRIIIVGAGPAGYFAALKCLELGMKPIVLDRGKAVRERRRDLRAIQQFGQVNPKSNYCFGEGGAGTYSDGKLYTRSHKRGKIQEVLEILVEHGASTDILIDAHPHIGSNKLPGIVTNIRNTILQNGGEIHFGSQVTDFIIDNNTIQGVSTSTEEYLGEAVILAAGHSARDIFSLCERRGVQTEFKPFALGVRIEHPQGLIDRIQYRQKKREENLPAASYKLVCQVEQKGVFSFCMCPGGLIVPAATAPGKIVVNNMSLSKRHSPYANSGIVTSLEWDDLTQYHALGKYAGIEFQKSVERNLFDNGDGSQACPAQRITDFVEEKPSQNLNPSSYIPGLYSAPMHELLPGFIVFRLQQALKQFGRKMKGYYTEEAQIIGVESRTSSPIRIPRNVHYESPTTRGLFPCGEGAGYAGGILSAALDGQNVAKAINKHIS